MLKQKLIVHDFNLPDYSNELSKAKDVIKICWKEYKKIKRKNAITDIEHIILYKQTINVLNHIGKLSMPAFEIENELKEMYEKQFVNSPELAKKLWLIHYEKIHHPYNILKNRCFRLLDCLDKTYININKKYPPNW